MLANRVSLVCFALSLLATTGCGTMVSLRTNQPYPNVIYGGTYLALHGHGTFLDAPFSALADTIVLPYTVPKAIHNCNHPENRPLRYEPPLPATQPEKQ